MNTAISPKLRSGRRKILFFCLAPLLFFYWIWLPEKLFNDSYSTVLLDERNELLAAKIAQDGQWRFPEADSVPVKFKQCIIQFEDEYFKYHPGVNPVSVIRSLKNNLSAGRVKSGGSTITMQLARMIRGRQERTYVNKIIEMLLATRLEFSHTKKRILELYCAHAPFGSNVVGLEAAAWRYFGRSAHKLSWAEQATLAVLPNAPALIYPGKNQFRLLNKRNRLLKKLYDRNIIDKNTYELSISEPLPTEPFPLPQISPHLLERVIKEHGAGRIYRSTLNYDLQKNATSALDRHIQQLSANQIHNACLLITETHSGKVLAYVGNSHAKGNEFQNYVDIIQSPRSTGSILKPFLYAFMLDEGKILPSSLIEDVPIQIGAYGPKNFDQSYDGLVPADKAISRSLNVPAVKMLMEYGTGKFHQRLKQLGFTTFQKPASHYGLSLILGGGEATLWEVAGAYASLGRILNGYSNARNRYSTNSIHVPEYLKKQSDKKNNYLKNEILHASSVWFTLQAMTELIRPQEHTSWMQFQNRRRIAWKTGTSFGFRDAWAIGMNAKYTIAVWVGNASGEGRPDLTGTAAAAPLLFTAFGLLANDEWFKLPYADMKSERLCVESGYKASDICPETKITNIPITGKNSKVCPYHHLIQLDETETFRVNSECYPVHQMKSKPWFVTSPVQEYFYRSRNSHYKPLPPHLKGCMSQSTLHQLEIIYPRNNFKIYLPVDENGNRGKCIFKATHKNGGMTLFWYLDGEYAGNTEKFHQLSIQPSKGTHQLTITDEEGTSSTVNFELIEK